MGNMKTITEGKAIIHAETPKVVSRKMDVFYNPLMEFNRTLTILLLSSLSKKPLKIALPLAGSGIRAVRFMKEMPELVKELYINDYDEKAIQRIKENFNLNGLGNENIKYFNTDASLFLWRNKHFDYIDIDPFGSPNPFLDASARSIKHNGILAVTATDTAPLAGTYIKACRRKYWAEPLRNEFMHEIGLRILIRKVQLIFSQYERAAMPILSYARDHYYRIFFRIREGKKYADEIKHYYLLYHPNTLEQKWTKTLEIPNGWKYAGPMWAGSIQHEDTKNIDVSQLKKSDAKFVEIIKNEVIEKPFIYDLHRISKKYGFNRIIPMKDAENKLKESNIEYSRVHHLRTSIRTRISIKEFMKIIR